MRFILFVTCFLMFRFEYDKKMSELSCADEDHPLKVAESLPTAAKSETEGNDTWHIIYENCNGINSIFFLLF